MKKIIIIFGFCLLLINFFTPLRFLFANDYNDPQNNAPQTVELPNPLGEQNTDTDTVNTIIGKAINAVLGIVGSLALVMFIYGGVLWMTAAGNEQRVQKGKDTLFWAVLGLIVIFASYSIVTFVLEKVVGGAGGT